ncbi:hypothetical protein DPEC_G00102890 [Dallia pectoralis]|uniref:Uncharacterized protein n=1 Tax=Dallia pectoralis TaxID=75939 RepID=A0ACC2GX23_DALPE|nr:hypothetical protein DPEC_G00102890 [Dallia pectoralis]
MCWCWTGATAVLSSALADARGRPPGRGLITRQLPSSPHAALGKASGLASLSSGPNPYLGRLSSRPSELPRWPDGASVVPRQTEVSVHVRHLLVFSLLWSENACMNVPCALREGAWEKIRSFLGSGPTNGELFGEVPTRTCAGV